MRATWRVGGWGAGLVLGLASAGVPAWAIGSSEEVRSMTRSGDVLQVGIPLAAFAMTFVFDGDVGVGVGVDTDAVAARRGPALVDWGLTGSPRHDLVVAMMRTEVVTHGLKFSVRSERPNGKPQSFPSGHTAAAFTGAEFIRKHHGGALGIAAYVSATYVGWTRVVSGNHWTHDVMAGAAIGILSNHDTLRWGGRSLELSVVPMLFEASGDYGRGFDEPLPQDRAVLPTLQLRLQF